jgi:hypothetical protein
MFFDRPQGNVVFDLLGNPSTTLSPLVRPQEVHRQRVRGKSADPFLCEGS